MRRSIDERIKRERLITILNGVFIFCGVVFVSLALFSFLITAVEFSEKSYSVLTGISLSAGGFFASFAVARRRKHEGLKSGIICGVIVFIAVFFLGRFFVNSFSVGKFISKLLIIISCTAIGGIIGVNNPKKN